MVSIRPRSDCEMIGANGRTTGISSPRAQIADGANANCPTTSAPSATATITSNGPAGVPAYQRPHASGVGLPQSVSFSQSRNTPGRSSSRNGRYSRPPGMPRPSGRVPLEADGLLVSVEAGIYVVLVEEVVVSTVLDDPAAVEDQDLVGAADRAQAMRDEERGPGVHQARDGFEDPGFRAGVHGRRRLIEDEDR